jgi:putative membrane protein insertion efficiency factor
LKPITEHCSNVPSASYGAEPSLAVRTALRLIRAYKVLFSLHFAGACRYLPSCADYAAEALARHGLLKGGWLAVRRLSRCHPLGAAGHDPVPS